MNGTSLTHCAAFALEISTFAEFTAWLNGTSEADWDDDAELQLELLGVEYRNRADELGARALLRRTLEARVPDFDERVRASRLARDLLAGRMDLVAACDALHRLYDAGLGEIGAQWAQHEDALLRRSSLDERLIAAIHGDARAALAALARTLSA